VKGIYKKTALYLIVLFLFYGTALAGGDKYSFRMRGLGTNLYGLISDLYSDIYFNPAYLSRFMGTTIYTNLSSLQGRDKISLFGDEFSVRNSKDLFPSNLYGAVTTVWGKMMGIFYESSGYDVSMTDETIRDEYSSAIQGVRNKNSLEINGDFSTRNITIMGMVKGWGYIVSWNKYGFDVGYKDEEMSSEFTVSDTSSNKVFSNYERTVLERKMKFPGPRLGFSFGKVFKGVDNEVSFSAGMRPERINFNAQNVFSVFKEPFFGGTGNFEEIEEDDFGFMEVGLRSYFVNLRYKKIEPGLATFNETNYLVSYNRHRLPIEVEATEISSGDTLTQTDVLRSTKTVSTSIGSGTGSINRLIFGYGKEKHFDGLKSMLALGAKLTVLWGSMDYEQGPSTKKNTNTIIDEGTSVLDTTDTFLDNRVFRSEGEAKGVLLSLPIGVETQIGEKFTLRMGANTWIPLSFSGKWRKDERDLPDTMADTAQTYTPDVTVPSEKSEAADLKAKILNMTTYYFGASFDMTQNIRIDLLHFANLTRLDTWWLSVILKY